MAHDCLVVEVVATNLPLETGCPFQYHSAIIRTEGLSKFWKNRFRGVTQTIALLPLEQYGSAIIDAILLQTKTACATYTRRKYAMGNCRYK